MPQLLFDPMDLEPVLIEGSNPSVMFPGVQMTGLVVAEHPAWLWIAPVMTPDIYADPNVLVSLMTAGRAGEDLPGWLYLPPYGEQASEALAYLEFVTTVSRLVAVKLGYRQIARISLMARAQLRVAVERTLLG